MVCSCCKIDKEDKHFRKYTDKDGYIVQRRQCYSCLYMKQQIRIGKKVAPIVPEEEPEVLEVKGVTKKCAQCKKVLPGADYYKSHLGTWFKYCRKCHVELSNKANRETQMENGGSIRVPPKPNVFVDDVQQSQTHQFLRLCGWSFTNGVWWKKGIKTKDKVWERFTETPKPKRIGHHNTPKRLSIHQKTAEIVEQYDKGIDCFTLAEIYNCSHTSIRKLIRDYNDERRGN